MVSVNEDSKAEHLFSVSLNTPDQRELSSIKGCHAGQPKTHQQSWGFAGPLPVLSFLAIRH